MDEDKSGAREPPPPLPPSRPFDFAFSPPPPENGDGTRKDWWEGKSVETPRDDLPDDCALNLIKHYKQAMGQMGSVKRKTMFVPGSVKNPLLFGALELNKVVLDYGKGGVHMDFDPKCVLKNAYESGSRANVKFRGTVDVDPQESQIGLPRIIGVATPMNPLLVEGQLFVATDFYVENASVVFRKCAFVDCRFDGTVVFEGCECRMERAVKDPNSNGRVEFSVGAVYRLIEPHQRWRGHMRFGDAAAPSVEPRWFQQRMSWVERVTEVGVRFVGGSSWAFAMAVVDRACAGSVSNFTATDLVRREQVAPFESLMRECGVDYRFIHGDDLQLEFAPTDLLFIDTWHAYKQLHQELERLHPLASKFIVLHDTSLFAERDEGLSGRGDRPEDPSLYKGVAEAKQGLWLAVEEFLVAHPEWFVLLRATNNNGLTVLAK